MDRNKLLLRAGVTGTVIAALCCFTPALVILLGVVGLSSLTGYLDMVLLPALVVFIGLTGYALYQKSKSQSEACCKVDAQSGNQK